MIFKTYLIEKNIDQINKNFFLFYGENIGLKKELKSKIKNKFKNAEIISYDQGEILQNNQVFFRELGNLSLFEKEKIFFIENTNDKILSLIRDIVDKFNSTRVILFADVLEKKSKLRIFFEKGNSCGIAACYPDNEITIKRIIQERLVGYSGLNTSIINLIADKCNLDRAKVQNEITKIETFFQNKKIDIDKLENLLDLKTNENFDLLKNEAFKGEKAKTNKLLSETIFEDEKNVLYLNLLNQRLHKLCEIKQDKNKNLEIAINNLKPPIFWKEKDSFIQQAKKWDIIKLRKVLEKTYSVEKEIKSNSIINKKVLMKNLIVEICCLANS